MTSKLYGNDLDLSGMDEFEDLDEIIARYIQPMAAFARDITNYKYYVDSEGGKRDIMEKIVMEEKRKANSRLAGLHFLWLRSLLMQYVVYF